MSELKNLPPQQLPFKKKTKEWRKQHLEWADSKTFFNYSLVRRSVLHKKINYDLLNGKVHMQDMELVLNPDGIKAGYIPDKIQHYPIMNSKLNVLRGEEAKRIFDYRVVITNPNAISEIETNKKNELFGRLQQLIADNSVSEEDFNAQLEELNDYYLYEWQDLREVRANALLNHYVKELNMPLIFNNGFMDAMTVGEEIYQCDIVGGEPTITRLNPLKIRMFRSGYSNKIEDADIVILEDYWSPSKIIDTYYDVLSKEDIKYIECLPDHEGSVDSTSNYDERDNFVLAEYADGHVFTGENQGIVDTYSLFTAGTGVGNHMYYDNQGNIRVLRMYWKSRRKVKEVKSYDPVTGDEIYTFYPENYTANSLMGEEEKALWLNEAWEGTKIGEKIYINMRPRVIQYNSLSNPSRCHFGIVGSIYNLNEQRPFSLVDMMKSYNYLYDAVHDRLNKAIAANWGKILEVDLASVPKGWDIDRWLYYAKINKIAVKDSFKEGNAGAAMGKLAGGFAANSRGAIDAETGNYIQQQVNLLEFIKMEMSEVAGITRQREGQISNRETVGGVERATLQSSHITEWLYTVHDDVKKRALECFLETAKIALKGQSKKFQYIMSDMSARIMDIDGDEFAECDYGLVVDTSPIAQQLNSKIDMLAQAALQNQALSFSTIMKLYGSSSIAEKQRMIEQDEQELLERSQENQQQQLEVQQQQIEADAILREEEMALRESINIRDNETRILIEQMKLGSTDDELTDDVEYTPEKRAELLEKIREFDEKLKLDKEKLQFEKSKHQDEIAVKRQTARRTSQTTNN